MTYYVCTPLGHIEDKPEGAEMSSDGDPFAPSWDSEPFTPCWVRRYGDDREPTEAFAAFFKATVEEEWASIFYTF